MESQLQQHQLSHQPQHPQLHLQAPHLPQQLHSQAITNAIIAIMCLKPDLHAHQHALHQYHATTAVSNVPKTSWRFIIAKSRPWIKPEAHSPKHKMRARRTSDKNKCPAIMSCKKTILGSYNCENVHSQCII